MIIYVVHDFASGYYATFDSKEKLNDFITQEKIKWIKMGYDYLEEEDYSVTTCKINKGFFTGNLKTNG